MIFSEDGYVYTQVPFKSNEEGIYGVCAPKGAKNIKDSIVRIKCFYILLENYKKGERYEYLVTMIPSKQVETQGKDYDFLSKPNFTGLVIYSSLEGEYIREEIYENGAIFGGKMLKPGTDNKECTKSGKGDGSPQNPFVLNTVVCTAHYDRRSGDDILRDWMDGNLSSNDKNNMTEITTSIANDPDYWRRWWWSRNSHA